MSTLIKLLNYFIPLWDFLYILQLEEYELDRYLQQVRLRILKRNFQKRDHLVYTARIKLIFMGTVLFLAVPYAALANQSVVFMMLTLLLLPLMVPFVRKFYGLQIHGVTTTCPACGICFYRRRCPWSLKQVCGMITMRGWPVAT